MIHAWAAWPHKSGAQNYSTQPRRCTVASIKRGTQHTQTLCQSQLKLLCNSSCTLDAVAGTFDLCRAVSTKSNAAAGLHAVLCSVHHHTCFCMRRVLLCMYSAYSNQQDHSQLCWHQAVRTRPCLTIHAPSESSRLTSMIHCCQVTLLALANHLQMGLAYCVLSVYASVSGHSGSMSAVRSSRASSKTNAASASM